MTSIGRILASVSLLAGVLSWVGPVAARANDDHQPMITVTGQGEVHVEPDMATVTVGVTYVAPSADQAMGMVSDGLSAVIASARSLGVASRDIQTTGLSLSPIYRNNRPNTGDDNAPQQITGYRASNNVSLIVRDLTKASDVLDGAVNAGANNIGGISFGLSDPETPRQQVLAAATANAQAKAQTIASAAGVALGGVISITEGSSTVPVPRVATYAAMAAAPAPAAPPVEAGEMTVRATVTVSYAI